MTNTFNTYFFMGKGGVGKTTCAASFSLATANYGFKTLIVSLDPAHNLGDVFNLKLSEKPTKIIDNLYAIEVDFDKMVQEHLKQLTDKIKDMYGYLRVLNLDKYIDILRHSPGIEEYATLEKITEIVEFNLRKKDYDIIIFDTPPTGLTIRIMALPSISLVWVQKLMELRKTILSKRRFLERIHGEKLRATIGGKELIVPSSEEEDPVFKELEKIHRRVELVNNVLTNPKTTSTVMIVNPELLSVLEAHRAYEFLKNINVPMKALIINKILTLKEVPEELSAKIAEQEKAVQLIEKKFKDLKILRIPLFTEEPTGIENLLKIAKHLAPLIEAT